MKAAVLREFRQPITIEDIETPEPGAGEVLIKVHACGVCHSDLHLAEGDWDLLKRVTKLPLVLGHEVAGTIAKVGPDVADFALGDRVGVPWLHWSCGECEYCREGREVLCGKQAITGVTVDGGFAEFLRAKASHTARLPDTVSFEEAAPLFCAGLTAHRALKSSGLAAGQRVAVFGVGGLGHLAIQIVKAKGAVPIAVDIADDKLALARELGAAHTINAGSEDTRKVLRGLGGAHIVIVTSASKAAYESAFGCVRKGGTLAVVGMPPEAVPVSMVGLVAGEIRVVASAVGTREDMRELLELAATGAVRCRYETLPLEDAADALNRVKLGSVSGRIVLLNRNPQ
jgi:propanol-preferring alcohol dehydrogenase